MKSRLEFPRASLGIRTNSEMVKTSLRKGSVKGLLPMDCIEKYTSHLEMLMASSFLSDLAHEFRNTRRGERLLPHTSVERVIVLLSGSKSTVESSNHKENS